MFLLREVTKLQVDYEPLGLLIFYSLHTYGQNAEHSLIITALCVFFVASYAVLLLCMMAAELGDRTNLLDIYMAHSRLAIIIMMVVLKFDERNFYCLNSALNK